MLLVLLMGLIAGVAGGMGMGGGTFLIPLLGFLDIPQKAAQAANLIGFLPMAAVALYFHFKNKLVKTKDVWFVIIPALVFSAAGAFFMNLVPPQVLKISLGVFFFAVGGLEIFKSIKQMSKNKKK